MNDINYGHPAEGHPLNGKHWVSTPDGPMIVSGKTPIMLEIPIPDGFRHAEELLSLSHLVVELLANGMPEREIANRLMRYHPAGEG